MYVQLSTCALHYLFSYFFIIYLELNLQGTAYSNALTTSLNMIFIYIIAYKQEDIKEAFFLPTRESF